MLKGGRYLDWIGPALLRHRDGAGLREYAGSGKDFCGLLIDDTSVWSMRVWNRNDITGGRASGTADQDGFISWLDNLGEPVEGNELYRDVAARLSWEYPFGAASMITAKVSVTELKRRFDSVISEDADVLPGTLPTLVRRPRFLEEKKGPSAAEAGTILHFVMQHLDFRNGDIESQIVEMKRKELITEQQAMSIDDDKIRKFISSGLGTRMLASEKIYREKPFNIEIPCHELYAGMEGGDCKGETVLLQGVIDCYFEEPDGLVLLDYKTDYVPTGGLEQIRERYRVQIGYYARALALLTGKQVKGKYVYLFWSGEVLEY
jgi:ATP-dependent helicase/nuclease subunit A